MGKVKNRRRAKSRFSGYQKQVCEIGCEKVTGTEAKVSDGEHLKGKQCHRGGPDYSDSAVQLLFCFKNLFIYLREREQASTGRSSRRATSRLC